MVLGEDLVFTIPAGYGLHHLVLLLLYDALGVAGAFVASLLHNIRCYPDIGHYKGQERLATLLSRPAPSHFMRQPCSHVRSCAFSSMNTLSAPNVEKP